MRSRPLIAVVVISLGLPVVARAGGDPAAGKTHSVACLACHGADATSDLPRLAGQRERYLARQLLAFKSGDRKSRTMTAIIAQLSEPELADLAAYWSSQDLGSDTAVPPEVTAIRASRMPFPRGFPTGFVQFTITNKPDRHVVTRAYVNKVALQAAKAGRPPPDGSAIVLENYAPKLAPDGKPLADKDGTWVPDKLMYYEGMEARAGWGDPVPPLLRNANWSYAVFTPDKAPREINQATCLACHKTAPTSFVFDWAKVQAKASAR
jgi:cytochrome c553